MTKHLSSALVILASCALIVNAQEPEKASETKKPLVKPPFPDGEPEIPVLPVPKKITVPVELEVIPAPRVNNDTNKGPIEPEMIPAPRLNDTNKPFDIIMVAADDGAEPAKGNVAVGFFNHGERDITLEVNKRTLKLSSRHYVQLKLPREFGWREKDGPMQTTNVPSDAAGVEIVFRR